MPDADYIYILGQVLGAAAVVLGFLTYQMKTQKQLVIVHLITCAVFSVHYFLLGAMPACVLNAVGTVRNIVYFNRDEKSRLANAWPIIFAVIMGVMGAVSRQGMYSLLVIAGLVINTLCVSLKNSQTIRKSILITSPMVLLYDVIVMSIGGVIYESVAIVSAIIGIIRYKRKAEITKKGGISHEI